MALPPLSTILNNAPLIIQGANHLLKMLRDKNNIPDEEEESTPASLDEVAEELKKINQRLEHSDKSDIQQIELIEALAKQNESLANSLQASLKKVHFSSAIAIVAIVIAAISLAKVFNII